MDANFEQFFKMSKRLNREEETKVALTTKKKKFVQMNVHTYNALKELLKKEEAKNQEVVDELEEFYKENIEDNKNRLYSEIDFERLYQELRK